MVETFFYLELVCNRRRFWCLVGIMEEVNCFFEDINIAEMVKKGGVQVKNLRHQMEQPRGEPHTLKLKKLFMILVADKFKEFKKFVGHN